MNKRTFLKTIVALGYIPAEGTILLSDENLEPLINPEIKISHSELDELFQKKILPEKLYQKLINNLEEQETIKNAEIALKQQQIDEEIAAKEAVIEAEKQVLIEKRQEELRAKIRKKAAAEEAERIEALEAEKLAAQEAEKQAAIEAERLAAIEAAKPRKFSAA